MNDKTSDKPAIDSPEFEAWLRQRTAKYKSETLGSNNSDFDERELASGDINDLHKTDAELFPDELEEFTPEERRKNFELHKNDTKVKKD